MESRLSINTGKAAFHDKGWFTSAFIPRTPDGPAAAPRIKAPGSSSFCATVFKSYSWKQVWPRDNPTHSTPRLIFPKVYKQHVTLCFWATGIRYGTPPTSVTRGLPHKPAVERDNATLIVHTPHMQTYKRNCYKKSCLGKLKEIDFNRHQIYRYKMLVMC